MQDDWKPNLFVPGFAKCGTTALCDYLSQHPDIYIIEGKEPRTLSIEEKRPAWTGWLNSTVQERFCLDFESYKQEFDRNKHYKYRGEGSQSYTYLAGFHKKLKGFAPDAKIILMIREPKERMLSLYFYTYDRHLQHDFAEWIDKFLTPDITTFFFRTTLKLYYESFGDNIRVIGNESLVKSPQQVMDQICGFLQLEPMTIRKLQSNVGQFKSLDDESLRKNFSNSYRLAYAATASARRLLDAAGVKDKGVRSKLSRISPIVVTKNRFSRTSSKRVGGGYSEMMRMIPKDLADRLEQDYSETIDFCRTNRLLLVD